MLRILWSSRSAMAAQQEKLDSISNNIANVNTVGYKKVEVGFKDLVYETLKRKGYPVNTENNSLSYNGIGVRAAQWARNTMQGGLKETGISTDLAIYGQGYFKVYLPEKNADGTYKTAYTRNGSFSIDSSGSIVDCDGNRLAIDFDEDALPEDKVFTKDNFNLDENGIVYKTDGIFSKAVGKINLYNVVSQDSLKSIGNSLYAVNTENVNGTGTPAETPYVVEDSSINQGFLEQSNVDLTKEMTDMIVAQRAFELNSRAMRTADEMWSMANNLKSK